MNEYDQIKTSYLHLNYLWILLSSNYILITQMSYKSLLSNLKVVQYYKIYVKQQWKRKQLKRRLLESSQSK